MRWYTVQTYWIGIALFFIWLAVLLKIIVIDPVRHNIRKRYMLRCGYRYLMRHKQGYSGYEWWGYTKDDQQIEEDQIDSLPMREVRQRFQ